MWWLLLLIPILVILWLLMLRCKRKKADFFGLNAFDYAHRGLHDIAHGIPENSLRAFRLAAEYGYGAELDVHLSADGKLIVMHDESLLRTAGVEKKIADCTMEELSALRLEGTDEKIPLLEEVLPIFAGRTPLIVEIKAARKNHAALTEATCRALDQFPTLQYCIESFDPRVLLWLRRNRPKLVRGQLSCNFIRDRSGLSLPIAFALTNLLSNFLTEPHFVAYNFADRKRLSLRICKRLWGVQEVSWTIRDEKDAAAAKQDGAILIFERCRP